LHQGILSARWVWGRAFLLAVVMFLLRLEEEKPYGQLRKFNV
jgi:hypothetical protein